MISVAILTITISVVETGDNKLLILNVGRTWASGNFIQSQHISHQTTHSKSILHGIDRLASTSYKAITGLPEASTCAEQPFILFDNCF